MNRRTSEQANKRTTLADQLTARVMARPAGGQAEPSKCESHIYPSRMAIGQLPLQASPVRVDVYKAANTARGHSTSPPRKLSRIWTHLSLVRTCPRSQAPPRSKSRIPHAPSPGSPCSSKDLPTKPGSDTLQVQAPSGSPNTDPRGPIIVYKAGNTARGP